jgi:hypothetical protein
VGAACASIEQCEPGLFCAPDGVGGGACATGPEGKPCDPYDAPCDDGLFCDDDTDTCQYPHELGEDCWYEEPCVDGLYCDVSQGCQPEPGLGQECDYDVPCQDPYYCDGDSFPYTCQPDAQLGEPCTDSSLPVECAGGLYCVWDGAGTTCAPQKAQGEACSEDLECLSGACDFVYGCLADDQCVGP